MTLVKISWDAGHSLGGGPGYKESPDGYKEWKYSNEIVKLAISELSNYENVAQLRVDDTTGKRDVPLKERTDRVNAWGSNVHVSVHLNALKHEWRSGVGGTETYIYKNTLKDALALATKVQTHLVKDLGFSNRGVKTGNLHMVRETKMTAILVEVAFMDIKNEAMKMRTKEYQKKAALAIVKGLASQYNLKKKKVEQPKPKAPETSKGQTYFRVVAGSFSDRENAEAQQKALKKAGFPSFLDAYTK